MKFLIAGYGSIGRRHLRNLRALGQHDLILLRSHQSTLVDDEIQGFPVETDVHAALAHQPDGVIIANPTALHLNVAIPAAESGCAILLEKPVSDNLAETERLRETLRQTKTPLQMGFQYRFHPGLRRVKTLLDEGAIGKPLSFRADWGEYLPDWHPWEDYRKSYSARQDLGGGVALTLCHPLDTARWLFGEIDTLWGFSGKVSDLEIAVDDLAEIGLRTQSGVIGSVHLDYYRRFVRNDMEICGREGVLTWNNADAKVTLQSARNPELQTILPETPFDRNQLFLDEMAHFIAVCAGTAQPSCTMDDGVQSERLVDALKQSWAEKRMIPLADKSSEQR